MRRVAFAIGASMDPDLRVMRILDGSLLDDDSMAILREMAAGHGYQLVVERVGSGSGLATRYGDSMLIQDYGNGNVASNAAGGTLLVGYKNTTGVQIIPEIHGNIKITKDPSAAEYPDVEVWGNVVVHGTIYYDGLEQN